MSQTAVTVATLVRNVQANTVLVRLSFRRLGNRKQASTSGVTTDADKKRIKLLKILFDSEEYEEIKKLEARANNYIARSIELPCKVATRGLHLISTDCLDLVDRKLTDYQQQHNELVERFIRERYEEEVTRGTKQLGSLSSSRDYLSAEEARLRFAMSWSYLSLGTPSNIPPDVQAREEEKLAADFERMAVEVNLGLMQAFRELASHLVERLGKDEKTGDLKGFKSGTVDNLIEFLDLFGKRNVTKNVELAKLAEKARSLMTGATSDSLRDNLGLRETVRKGMADVTRKVEGLIVKAPRRAMFLDGDDE